MPYVMEIDGMAELSETLNRLDGNAEAVASKALYKGAGIMLNEIYAEICKIKTAPFEYAKDGATRLPSPEEKEILVKHGVGIARFDKNGYEVDTSVGADTDGYVPVGWAHMNAAARTNYKLIRGKDVGSMKAKLLKMGKGQNEKPLAVIANAINSGTSFMQKQPYIRKAQKSGSPKAMEAMKAVIETEMNKTIEGTGGNDT